MSFPNNPIAGNSYTAPNGQIYVFDGYKWIGTSVSFPTASTTVKGVVKIDGNSILIDNNGTISAGTVVWDNVQNKPEFASPYEFYIAADDSTQRSVSNNELIKFIGSGIVTTSSDAEGNITISSSGITASSSDTLTNKTINLAFGQGNTFQIQGNTISSYTGSGPVVVLDTMPTLKGFNIGNGSSLTVDGGTGNYFWKPTFADGTGTIHKAGVYKSNPDVNNSLFTFGANGAGTMSVALEGSLFVGNGLPSNSGGLNTDYPGWLVVQSGGKFGGDVDIKSRLFLNTIQFEDDSGILDFFAVSAGNHIVTCANDWTLKLKARADGTNQGHLWLEAGKNTKIKIHGNGSNIDFTASDGSTTATWNMAKTGGLTFPDTTVQTTAFPSYLLNTDEHVIYVSENGDDLNNGLRPTTAFRTVKAALNYVALNPTNRSIVNILAGIYEEIFPLTIPANTLVRGAGLKAVEIHPTTGTRSNDCFYLDDNTGVTDLTIRGQLYNSGSNTGYAFRYNPATITITERSPYVERVTVLQKGSVTSSSDPYGFNQGDAGRGVFIDGRRVNRGSIEPAMLFNECTFFTPNSRTLVMTNGARCEWLNCFSYFSDLHYEAYFGDVGYGEAGKTYITLVGKAGTWTVGNTLSLYANDGVTVLGSGTIEAVSGSQLTLTGNVTGLLTNSARTAVTINVVGAAQLSTAQFKFSPSSLILNGTTDYISIASTPNYAYANADFAIEGWVYPTAIGGGTKTIVDQRTAATDVAVSLEMNNGGNIRVYINGAARITSGSPLIVNTWTHVAYARVGGVGRLFINGVVQATTYADGNNYGSRPLVIGAAFNNLQFFPGYVDEFRISTGIGRYSSTFSVATQPFTGDSNTATLLHFTGANASQSIIDDGTVVQDVRSSGGGTATGISRYDRSEFGALLRANSGAIVYGNQGAKATGAVSTSREDVVLQLMSYNIAYIGSGADLTNNRSTVVAANEVIELSGGRIIYVSVDQGGKFKVGNLFQVDFESGAVTFSGPTYNVTSLSGITFTSGGTSSYIDGTYISTGNLVLAGNTISTTTGNITLDPAGSGTLALNGDTTVTGALTVTNGVTFGANGTQTQAINYLNDLLDVTIAGTPTNGYVLKYNSGTGQWGPAPDATGGGGGGGVDLSQIYVTTTTASGGGTLSYDGAGQFTFAPADLSSYITSSALTGYATETWVTNQGYLTGITSGQVTGALGYTPIQLSSLSITTNSPSGSGSLSYNNTNGVFTFTPPSLASYLTAASLSVTTTTASGGGTLSYTNGVFTHAPAAATTINGTPVSPGGSISVGTVTSVSGTGTVNGITLTGTVTSTGSLTLGGTLGSIANNQLTNSTISGVALGSNLFSLTAGTAISFSSGTTYNGSAAITINNAGVTSAVAGTGISVSGATGAVTITNSGVTSIVAGTGISVSGATGAVTVSASGSPTFTNVTVTGQIIEPFQTYSTSISGSPSITFNCANGNVWRVTSTASSAWTALFTNVAVTTGQVTNITMIITQGATAYIPSAISINGTSVTPTWQGGSTPTGNANKQDAIAYGVMQTGASAYTVYAQLVSFG